MTFWQDPKLEPKRSFKFILSIPGGANAPRGLKEFLVTKVAKPNFSTTSVEHKFLNHTFYYPGKTTWSPVDVTIVDTVDPTANATQEIMTMLEQSGYELPSTPMITSGWGTISKKKAVIDALGAVKIKTIDSDGRVVEVWNLMNAWIQKVDFGQLAYDTEEVLRVTMTLQYDNAYVNVLDGDGKIPSASG